MMKNLFFILLLVPCVMMAQKVQPKLLRVEGEFRMKEMPERIQVNLNITEKDSKYQECFNKAVETRKKLKNAFIENGIDEASVKTNSLSVREDYEWENDKRKKVGFKARLYMVIEEDFTPEFADKLLKSFQNYSFDVDYNISFRLSEDQKKKLRAMATERAVNDAREKAISLSEAAGVRLKEIYRIDYGSIVSGFNTHSYYVLEDCLDQEPPPPIKDSAYRSGDLEFNPQELTLTKSVFIEWIIEG
jgi:uncharacterized protein YggE